MKVYLAGPINGCSDAEANDWRSYCKAHLEDTYDPMVRDYRGRELERGIASEIVENDKADIDQCEVVLVYYERPSVGTAMEVLYAYEKRKFVIVADYSGKPISPWLLYHADAVVSSLDEAFARIKNIPARYGRTIDAVKWVGIAFDKAQSPSSGQRPIAVRL